jgi:hypothetical protein
LQVKEATASVLEGPLPKSRYKQHGERVVYGQRMMQAASDILDWTKGLEANRYYYWRQLRDMKGSADVETMAPVGLNFYAGICRWTLARAHARSGDPIAIAAYLGEGDQFDRPTGDPILTIRAAGHLSLNPPRCRRWKLLVSPGRQPGSVAQALHLLDASPCDRQRP